jgi:transposase, IS6 family
VHPLVLTLFIKPTQRRGNDGRTWPVGRPHDRLALVSKVRSDDLSRLRGKLRYTTTTWHMGRNLRSNRRPVGCICSVRWIITAIRWIFYLSEKRDREAAKTFLQKALSDPDNRHSMPAVHGSVPDLPAAIRDLRVEGRLPQRCPRRTKRYANNRIESDHRQVKRRLRAMPGPRTIPTARRVIQGIEAVHMLRKGQLLGSQRTNLVTISIAFAFLLKMA